MNTGDKRKQGSAVNTNGHSLVSNGVQRMPIVAQSLPSKAVVSRELAKGVTSLCNSFRFLTFSNPKTIKGLEFGWVTAILHLAPANYSGYTVCKRFSQCSETCLYHQGRGRMKNVQKARIRRTRELHENFEDTMLQIKLELQLLQVKLRQLYPNIKLACRLNGLSDLEWEKMQSKNLGGTLFQAFPDVQFYDYTKITYGKRDAWTNMPDNYHLTFSFDGREKDIDNCLEVLSHGYNVMVVHNKQNYKHATLTNGRIWDYPTYDGEEHDLRFTDARPLVLIGREKGYSNIAI